MRTNVVMKLVKIIQLETFMYYNDWCKFIHL